VSTTAPAIVANICERWGMTLRPEVTSDEWFLDWVLRSPKEAGHHLTAGWLAYSSLKNVYTDDAIQTVTEYFGGMGAQSLMIQELFFPDAHTVGDYSAQAVDHLRRELPEAVTVRQHDAYGPEPDPPMFADLVGLDFGDLTAWKTRDGQPHRKLLDRVFEKDPMAVVFTDISCRYLHLHRERYESLLGAGTCDTYPHYLEALLNRFQLLYGYTLCAGYYDRWSAVMALVPDGYEPEDAHLWPTPAEPVGLELL
jgi:hypothetical protein